MANSKYHNRTQTERSEKFKDGIQETLSKELHAQTMTTSDIWEAIQDYITLLEHSEQPSQNKDIGTSTATSAGLHREKSEGVAVRADLST